MSLVFWLLLRPPGASNLVLAPTRGACGAWALFVLTVTPSFALFLFVCFVPSPCRAYLPPRPPLPSLLRNTSADGIYMYQGSDDPYVTNVNDPYYTGGLPSYNIIANNLIDGAAEGIKIGDTVGNEFTGNVSGVGAGGDAGGALGTKTAAGSEGVPPPHHAPTES